MTNYDKKYEKSNYNFGFDYHRIFGFIKLAEMFSPGSYGYAEIYELDYSEERVIEAVRQFIIQHPEMIVPKVTIQNNGSFDLSQSEGRKDNSYWYKNYFFYPKENQIVFRR